MRAVPPPRSEQELLARARELAGRSVGEVAVRLGLRVPDSMRAGKGFAGQLAEVMLGATAGSLSEPDFQHLGVEMKTIPVAADGRPLESTYVCTVPLEGHAGRFEDSTVYRKLARVLWLPVQGERVLALSERRFGSAITWSPDEDELRALRTDWEELLEFVALGRVEELSARHGMVLQVRPKAADSHARRPGVGHDGRSSPTLPRGFYLRAGFTAGILANSYVRG